MPCQVIRQHREVSEITQHFRHNQKSLLRLPVYVEVPVYQQHRQVPNMRQSAL